MLAPLLRASGGWPASTLLTNTALTMLAVLGTGAAAAPTGMAAVVAMAKDTQTGVLRMIGAGRQVVVVAVALQQVAEAAAGMMMGTRLMVTVATMVDLLTTTLTITMHPMTKTPMMRTTSTFCLQITTRTRPILLATGSQGSKQQQMQPLRIMRRRDWEDWTCMDQTQDR